MRQDSIVMALRAAQVCLADMGMADAHADATWLMAHVMGERTRAGLLQRGGEPLREAERETFDGLVARRMAGEPLQYIIGSQPFMGHDFLVDPRVLIPRPETEELCALALARIPLDAPARVLDMGTGSGALAVSVALARPRARVVAVDISTDALCVARENALRLHAERVRFVHSDLLAALTEETFDVILSNPPYIARHCLENLQTEVRCEPQSALDGGIDGLDFYRSLAQEAPLHLLPGGYLLVEIGFDQASAVSALFEGAIGPVAVHNDLQGLPRVVETQYTHGTKGEHQLHAR